MDRCRSRVFAGGLALPDGAVVEQDVVCPLAISPAQDLDRLVLEDLVRVEEVLDLDQAVRANLLQALDVLLVRIADGHAEHFEVEAHLVPHLEPADGACPDVAAGEGRLVDDQQGVGMITVVGPRPLDKPVVEVVVHGRRQHAIEPEHPGLFVELVLVAAAAPDFDDDLDDFRERSWGLHCATIPVLQDGGHMSRAGRDPGRTPGPYDASMGDGDAEHLRELAGRLDGLAEQRLATGPRSDAADGRARRLRDHLAGHVRVRAASLDAPLLVLLLGPTGAGKSSIFNTVAGRAASPTGVLRPTTRTAVVLVHPDDREALLSGTLTGIGRSRVDVVEDGAIGRGLALVDAPDLDSIEHANRELADQLVEAADLCIFVTTATRYADRVPWTVLDRVRQRGLPLHVVLNRMPPGEADQQELLADVERLFAESGLGDLFEPATSPRNDGTDTSGGAGGETGGRPRALLVGIPEGRTIAATESLEPAAIAPVAARIAGLRESRDERVALAARALTGSLAGLGQLLDAVADDCEHEAIDVDALRRGAAHHFERGFVGLREELGRGRFLREEALRHWHDFVGADQMTRFFSEGIGRVRGAIAGLLRPAAPPVAEVRAATTDDLVAVSRIHAAEAARRTATNWADVPSVGPALAADPSLWDASPEFEVRLRERLEVWIESIGADIQATGRPKRILARGASLGVNALGTGVMLGTFMHTGGLTGAEVGVAAATAFLNHKLLSALFGEAAMAELIGNARRRLDEALAVTFAEERVRFDRLVPGSAALASLATDLRAAAEEVRALPVGLPRDLQAVMASVEPVAVGPDDDPDVVSGDTSTIAGRPPGPR